MFFCNGRKTATGNSRDNSKSKNAENSIVVSKNRGTNNSQKARCQQEVEAINTRDVHQGCSHAGMVPRSPFLHVLLCPIFLFSSLAVVLDKDR